MKKFLFFELFILFTIIGFLVGDSFAGEVSVFGPKQYLRTSGSPNNYSDNFLAVSGQGKLVVKNGVWNGTKRIIDAVSSASVYVNGELIFGPGDFNKNTYLLEQNIPLNTDNSISVELASSPESYITIEIIQDIAPPDVSLNAVPSSLFFGQSSLLTWASNTAETCMIEPGIGEVALNGSVAVFPSKTTTYTITATGLGGSTTAHISVIVKNSPPIANSQSISTNEDNELSITLGGSDIDNDPLTYEILNSPSSGSLSGTSPNLIYTPDENFNGEDSFTFKVNDGQIDSEPATISIIVNPINDPPAANAGSDQQVTRTSTVVLDGTGSNDIDGDTLSYQWSFVSKPAGSIAAFSDPSSVNPFFVADISGRYELELIVNDGTENSAPDTVSITVSPRMLTVPSVTNFSQSDAESAITATGLVVGTITTANSDSVPLNAVISQSPEGGVLITEGSTINLTVSIGPVSLKPQVNLTASPAMINQGELSTLTWSSTNGDTAFIEPGIGSVAVEGSVVVAPDFTTTYTITVTGTDGSTSKSVVVSVIGKPETQPAGSFGEQYNDLIPGDATVGSYDSNRFAMITGHVQDILDNPIMDVNITIFNHPEYGTAKTNEQGQFTIPVDGGGVIKLIYQKEGYITSHRQLSVPWNDFAIAETIQMITEDPVSTTLTFDGNPDTIVTHQSTPVTDESGTRSCSMVFQGDNQAFLVDENGNDVQELTTITTRATEYTTPESMPAFLPPTSAFTYCVELTVDGTQRVRFTKPVITWVDNFLGFEVGEIVPVGYYDRDKGVWIGTQNGAVVRLLDTDNDGIVDALDATGDNVPDDLNGNGSFRDEVTGLDDSTRYQPGATFWRVALSHFSPRDMNWPWGPPIGAVEPNSQKIFSIDNKKCEDCKTNSGSYVENRSRIMNEDIPITGTDMTLHYSSNRVKDYKTLIDVPVSGSSVPSNLKHIIVKCEIAGVITERILDPLPNQKATFIWDGMDLNGNEVKTPMLANISIGFVYNSVYYTSSSNFQIAWAQTGGSPTNVVGRQKTIFWQRNSKKVEFAKGGPSDHGDVAQGWTISAQHQIYTGDFSTLYKGDGGKVKNKAYLINTVAMPINSIWTPDGFHIDPQGNLYIANNHIGNVLKVDTSGTVTDFAGKYMRPGYSGDGGPAIQAQLNYPSEITSDQQGNIYIADPYNHSRQRPSRIRKVDTNGIITTIAGGGTTSEDGVPANEAILSRSFGIACDQQGNLYLSEADRGRIRKVDTNGIITTVKTGFSSPFGLNVDQQGNLFICDIGVNRIYKMDTSGIVTVVAGTGSQGYSGDGGKATEARLYHPFRAVSDSYGNLYFSSRNNCIRKIDTNGIITTIAGTGTQGYGGDGYPAVNALLSVPFDLDIDPQGDLYILDSGNSRIRKIENSLSNFIIPGFSESIPIADQNGLAYIMSPAGKHQKTIDLDTGTVLFAFDYQAFGDKEYLISITDQLGNITTINRDLDGKPTSITSPDEIVTMLSVDSNHHLKSITNPDAGEYNFLYTTGGLLTRKIEPNLNTYNYVYNANGRITETYDENGGQWLFGRLTDENSTIFSAVTTGEGNTTTYKDDYSSSGEYISEITDPAGDKTYFTQSEDGLSAQKELSCGTTYDFKYGVDPEYKYDFLREIIESTPSGNSVKVFL